MPSLILYRGDTRLSEVRLRPGRTTIGRADTCDLALPGEEISRTHCVLQGTEDRWEVIDRSRHGTRLNGETVKRAPVARGGRIGVGPYEIELCLDSQTAGPTAEAVPDRGHERILAADDVLCIERAELVVVSGSDAGLKKALKRSRVTIGGRGSGIVLRDPALVSAHCRLRVARGRVMLEPGDGPTYLDGDQIREITPLYAEEEFRIGNTLLRVEIGSKEEVPLADRFGEMVGESRTIRQVFGMLRRMAGHHHPVLIQGESGTGKELAARGVHEHSLRAGRPFVPVNCGAVAEGLFESELFGHEKGAFTGAVAQTDGAFHQAAGGTLFLDEVGELPEPAQAKLLRALESGEVRRVGSAQVSYPDVRVVAATNRDLLADVRAGRFREDLFFRLAVLSVHLPALRERPTDLEILCRTLCRGLHPEAHVTPDALEVLKRHAWPGNVRELRNVLVRATVLGGPRVTPADLSFHVSGPQPALVGSTTTTRLEEAERDYIQSVLNRHGANRSAAARELGIARSTLHYKIRKLGLS